MKLNRVCTVVEIPTGYMSDAKTTHEETLLPLPGSTEFAKEAPEATDYCGILDSFRSFVETVSSER